MGARKGLKSSVKIPSNSALREKWLEDANFEWARATKVLPVWKYVPGVCTVVRSEAQRSFLTQGQKLMFSNLTKSKRFKLYYIMPLLKTGTTSIHKKILAVLPAANSACWVGFFIGKVLPVSGNSPPLSRPISNTGNAGWMSRADESRAEHPCSKLSRITTGLLFVNYHSCWVLHNSDAFASPTGPTDRLFSPADRHFLVFIVSRP